MQPQQRYCIKTIGGITIAADHHDAVKIAELVPIEVETLQDGTVLICPSLFPGERLVISKSGIAIR